MSVSKLMLHIMINVEDINLHSVTQNLKTIHLKDIQGENVETVVSYLKGMLILLHQCGKVLTDMTGLLNNIMASVECNKCTHYTKSTYFSHKIKTKEVTFMEYLTFEEAEYCKLYHAKLWIVANPNP